MPANVTYDFVNAKQKYESATNDEERLIALQEMLSKAPTHKGAENLRKDISRKIAQLKNKMEKRNAVTKKGGYSLNIKNEGDGQIVIVGQVNSGKSTFLKEYTNAKPEIANYAYTTKKPELGVLNYGGVIIQLIEIPSLLESKEMSPQLFSLIRVSNGVILIIRNGSIEELNTLIELLEKQDVYITIKKPKINFVKSKFTGVSFVNEHNLLCDKEQAIQLIKDSGFRAHSIILNQKTTIEDLLLIINHRAVYLPAIAVSMSFTKKINFFTHKNIDVFDVSDITSIKNKIFTNLNKIIIYTKKPGEKVDLSEPLILNEGATVQDAAKCIHKSIYKNLKSVKLWGSAKFPGQIVSKDYILKNKDIIEFII